VSETEICEVKLGIWMERRELIMRSKTRDLDGETRTDADGHEGEQQEAHIKIFQRKINCGVKTDDCPDSYKCPHEGLDTVLVAHMLSPVFAGWASLQRAKEQSVLLTVRGVGQRRITPRSTLCRAITVPLALLFQAKAFALDKVWNDA
jgi:hypothetical protein